MVTLGSFPHIAILLTVALVGLGAGILVRCGTLSAGLIRMLGGSIIVSESVWYLHLAMGPWTLWPGLMPFHLCDLTLWLTAIGALSGWRRMYELAYYWGLAGTTMALLTPDVQGFSWSYATIQFFVSHGLVVATLLAMAVSGRFRIIRASWVRAFLWLHFVAALLFVFNAAHGSNYLYLMSKPGGASLLDLLGPWPWYLLSADVLAAVIFILLSLPHPKTLPPST